MDEEEEIDVTRMALTPRGFYQLHQVMENFKAGMDLEDIAAMLDLAGKEHIQLLMVIAETNETAEHAELYKHPIWSLSPEECIVIFDIYADAAESDREHREFHAAGSAFSFFQNTPGVLPDEFTRDWLEGLYEEVTDIGIPDIS